MRRLSCIIWVDPECPKCPAKREAEGDFPGGPVVKNPPSNAGDSGLIPGWGTRIPHATGQLSLRATTTEHMNNNY